MDFSSRKIRLARWPLHYGNSASALVVRRLGGWLLRLGLLLKLLLPLLLLLLELLRRTSLARLHAKGPMQNWIVWLLRLFRLFGGLRRLVFGALPDLRALPRASWSCVALGRQHQFARRTLALVADNQDVIAGAVQQLIEHVPRRSRPIAAKDALVALFSFNLDPGRRRNLGQYLRQA